MQKREAVLLLHLKGLKTANILKNLSCLEVDKKFKYSELPLLSNQDLTNHHKPSVQCPGWRKMCLSSLRLIINPLDLHLGSNARRGQF